MRYDHLGPFAKHLEGAKPLHFSPLYLILGKENFECQEAIHLLLSALFASPKEKEFGLSVIEGGQLLEEKELALLLYSRSFFSEKRVIWIQQVEKLRESIQNELEKVFLRPIPSLTLLLSGLPLQRPSSFYKAAEKGGVILEFAEVKPWEKEKRLAEWVGQRMAAARKLIAYPTCQVLAKQTAGDQALLAQEVEKLLCYCIERQEVTLQDVERICTRESSDSIWHLGEAIFRRDRRAALERLGSLLGEGQALLPILRQLRSQFQTDYQVALLLAQKRPVQEITQSFPYMKGQILEKHLYQAREYGLSAFKKGILVLDETEQRLKNSFADEKRLVELLVFKLTS